MKVYTVNVYKIKKCKMNLLCAHKKIKKMKRIEYSLLLRKVSTINK